MKKFITVLIVIAALVIFFACLACIISGLFFREFGIIPWALIGIILSPIFIFRPATIAETPNFISKILGRDELQNKPEKTDLISMPKKYIEDIIEEKQQYKEVIKEIVEIVNDKDQSIQELKGELQKSADLIKQYFLKSEINEFKYLNFFFVYNTKRILAWIVYSKQVDLNTFYKQAFFFGIHVDNIPTTLDVLKEFYMIEVKGSQICPTIRGDMFLKFIDFKYIDFRTISEVLATFKTPEPPKIK
jgi:uncharacterized membrane protein